MQSVLTALPELPGDRNQSKTAPVRGSGNLTLTKARRDIHQLLHQRLSILYPLTLR